MKHTITYLLAALVALLIVAMGVLIMWMSGWNPGDRGQEWGASVFATLFMALVAAGATAAWRSNIP